MKTMLYYRWLSTEEMSRLLQMFGLEMFAKLLDIPNNKSQMKARMYIVGS